MSDLDRYLTDDLVDKVADVLDTRRHNYDVNSATWKPYCICGWIAEEPYDVAAYDRHLAVEALKAAAPLIAAQALREAAETYTVTIPDALGYKVQAVFTEDLMARADRIEHAATCPHSKCPGGSLCCCIEAGR